MHYNAYFCGMNENIIYGLRCPKTDEYRYIGKSTSGLKRARAHLTFSHNDSVNIWVAELREEGLCPLVDILESCDEETLLIKEKFWIQFYESAGCKLMNSIVYKGSAINKLELEIAKEKQKLSSLLENVKNEIAEVSELCTFIKNRRKNLKIKQSTLSELCNVSLRTVIQIEQGKGNPSYDSINKILDVLGYRLVPTLKTN